MSYQYCILLSVTGDITTLKSGQANTTDVACSFSVRGAPVTRVSHDMKSILQLKERRLGDTPSHSLVKDRKILDPPYILIRKVVYSGTFMIRSQSFLLK